MTGAPIYPKILLKLSGEALMGDEEFGLHQPTVERILGEVAEAAASGVRVAVVVGGGNLFRGLAGAASGMDRARADQMGMLATIMNALALEDALERAGVEARALSAIPMPSVCEPYTRRAARAHLDAGRVVIFAGGTGNPFFTTDTAAALRAAEMGCDALLKATQVDGVYSADPKLDANAERFEQLSYSDVLARDLKVMDAAAIALARDNGIPVIVFSIHEKGGLARALRGEGRFTLVRD